MIMRRSRFIAAASLMAFFCLIAAIIALSERAEPTALPVVEAPAMPEPQIQAEPMTENDPVLDLFNPSEVTLTGQLNESSLKNRLEEMVVLTFVLRRCMYVSEQEYADSFQAIALYAHRMQPQNATGIIDAAIASASASYGLLYARSSCDDGQLPASAAQLAQWRATILSSPPQ